MFYESPGRLAEALADLAAGLGPRPAAVARELTKLHEETRRATLTALAAHYAAAAPKGEIVVVVGPPAPAAKPAADTLDAMILDALAALSVKDAAAAVAVEAGLPRREVYARRLRRRDAAVTAARPANARRRAHLFGLRRSRSPRCCCG